MSIAESKIDLINRIVDMQELRISEARAECLSGNVLSVQQANETIEQTLRAK